MNNIRCRIATLAGGSVLVTLLLIMAAFNVIIRCEMKDNADEQEGSTNSVTFRVDNEGNTVTFYNEKQITIDTGIPMDHLPYIILVDPKGLVVGRDLRIWELERIAKRMPSE